jgi:hypothetical protein
MYFFKYYHSRRNWDSSEGIITRLQAGLSRVCIPAGGREIPLFLKKKRSRAVPVPKQPPIQSVPLAISPGVKRLGLKANHLSPSAKVSNELNYTSAPSTYLHGVHRNNYTFTIRPDEGCYCLGCDAVYGTEENRTE